MKKIFLLLALFSVNVLATPVNINTADAQTIANALNGIGEKKAQAIIEYREKNGDFKTIESLMEVAGIGDKTVEKNRIDILLTDKIEKLPTVEVKNLVTKEKK
jgi:competence protein ComEA